MNQDSLVLVLTVFVGLVAVSQIGQFVALLSLQRRAKALQDMLAAQTPRIESTLQNAKEVMQHAKETIDVSRTQIAEVTTKANEVLDVTRGQLRTVETLLGDVTARTKSQLDRVELVLDDTLGRVSETVTAVHSGVMKPIKEISGISMGIRAALSHMMKGGRPSVAQATQDEEMFI